MWLSIVRFGPAVAIALATCAASTETALAQPETRPLQSAAAIAPDDGWSFDDIKDVCEAIQFIMFSIGVGAALFWFWFQHLPSIGLPRIEFDVDVDRVGENDVTWIIDIVATVKNLGRAKADLSELRFELESVLADRLSTQCGSLVGRNALTPLFEGEWTQSTFVLDAGTQTRRTFAAAIPKTITHVVVTAHVRNAKRTEVYDASRLVRLSG
jgi:hypothetical protein